MDSIKTMREYVHFAQDLRSIANKIDMLVLRYEEDDATPPNSDLGLGRDLNSALQKLTALTQTLSDQNLKICS
jgi:hypothetical protein